MDLVTKVRKRLKLEQWKTIITECRASGMTVTSWCKTHGIAEQTYYRNLKKLREMEIDKLPASLMPLPDEKPVAFRKLEVQTPIPDTQAAVIIHLNGATVEVSEGTSQQTIQAVLLALQNVVNLDARQTDMISRVIDEFKKNYNVELKETGYEFQKDAKQMLLIRNNPK